MIDSTIALRDGRTLAYCEHGDPSGEPVVLFHGSPGSRLFAPIEVPPGIRLITFDRPGYGNSDGVPGRTVLDVASDLAELLDALAIDCSAMLAWSGGCPFGAAFAFAYPSRTSALAIVSGPGPIDEVPGAWDRLGRRRGAPAKWVRAGDQLRATKSIADTVGPFLDDPVAFLGSGRGVDRDVVLSPKFRPMLEAQIVAAFRRSDGIAQDLIAMWLPFDFSLNQIRVPTYVFQGALDRDNHCDLGIYAQEIEDATHTIWPDLAHFALLVQFEQVTNALLRR